MLTTFLVSPFSSLPSFSLSAPFSLTHLKRERSTDENWWTHQLSKLCLELGDVLVQGLSAGGRVCLPEAIIVIGVVRISVSRREAFGILVECYPLIGHDLNDVTYIAPSVDFRSVCADANVHLWGIFQLISEASIYKNIK